MNKTKNDLYHFFLNLLRPHKWYVISLLLVASYWGINNTLSPYVLKLIIDKIAAFEGDKRLYLMQYSLRLLSILYCG